MIVIICGDRNWTDRQKIHERLSKLPKETLIVHGGCRGADLIAAEEASSLGLKTKCYPADWETYGKKAGPLRNSQMLKENPELVIAFHSSIENSKGTKDMITKAFANKITVELIM